MKHPVFRVLQQELEKIRHNGAYAFLLFLGPLIGILLLFFIFRQGVVQNINIAVVDQDNSALSVKIKNALESSPDLSILASPADIFQAQKMMENGTVDAIVLLPTDMEKLVFEGVESPVLAYINGTNVMTAGVVQRSILQTVSTVSGGIQLKKQLFSGKNQEEAKARILPVQIHQHVLFNPYTNYNYFLNSALVFIMLYLFAFLSSIYTFGNELKWGTGKELLETSGSSVRLAIVGKLLPYTLIFSGFAMFINYLLFEVDGMDGMPLQGSFGLLFLGQFVTIITYQAMGILVVALTYNMRLSLSIASAYSMMAITFSGLTFPAEGMPRLARFLTLLFPFTWWEKLFISQALRGAHAGRAVAGRTDAGRGPLNHPDVD